MPSRTGTHGHQIRLAALSKTNEQDQWAGALSTQHAAGGTQQAALSDGERDEVSAPSRTGAEMDSNIIACLAWVEPSQFGSIHYTGGITINTHVLPGLSAVWFLTEGSAS